MQKLLVAGVIAAALVPAVADAQTRELNHDRREVHQTQREIRNDVRRGDMHEAREDRRDLRDKRQELRHDEWRTYRGQNRAAFHRPAYVGPRGYRYQVWRPGMRIAPAYYGSRYVIADPWQYRLARPTGAMRWVRYGNDVLLIDTRSGYVRDVIRDFFW